MAAETTDVALKFNVQHNGTFVDGMLIDTLGNVKAYNNLGVGGDAVNRLSVYGTANFSAVGIGTTTPANALSVNGDADISGKLGIGTTTPLHELDVRGYNTYAITQFANYDTSLTTNPAAILAVCDQSPVGTVIKVFGSNKGIDVNCRPNPSYIDNSEAIHAVAWAGTLYNCGVYGQAVGPAGTTIYGVYYFGWACRLRDEISRRPNA
ncbi:hypothetical protein J7M00_09395 [bacterium]|nr:hypothetical protein [bacterium]